MHNVLQVQKCILKKVPRDLKSEFIYKKKDLKRKGKKIRFRPRNKVKIQEKKYRDATYLKI